MRSVEHGDLLFQIEPVCESFEEAWNAGSSPRIEQYLGGWSGESRRVLFRQLLDIDLYFREERGHPPDLDDYRKRFPDYGSTIAETYQQRRRDGAPADRPITAGARFGNYTIVREIGRGGMGVVYEARHDALERVVALKVLPELARLSPRLRQRFEQEARAVARLHHGNIVPIFEVGDVDGAPYYSMQLIEGQTLRDRVADGERSAETGESEHYERKTARLGLQIARALEYAHERGVIHRDVKPSNLLLDPEGVPWLIDFGLAKLDEGDMTTSGDLLGTIRYMPPERFGGECDERGDLYSLGLTLHEVLAGRPAYQSRDQATLMRDILAGSAEPLRRAAPAVSRDLETIITKASAPQPADRYSTAGLMATDLERLLAGLPITARRPSLGEMLWRWMSRNKAATSIVVLLAVTTVAAAVAAVKFDGQKRSIQAQKESIEEQNEEIQQQKDHIGTLLVETEIARDRLRPALYRSDMQRAGHEAFDRAGGARLEGILAEWYPEGTEPDIRGWEWSLFQAMVTGKTRLATRGVDNGIDWHPTKPLFATVGKSGGAVWDAEGPRRLHSLHLGSHARGIRWSPDGQLLAATDALGAYVLDAETGERVCSQPLVGADQIAWPPSGPGLFCRDEHEVVRWDFHTGETVPIESPVTGLPAMIFSRKGDRAAHVDRGQVHVMRASTGTTQHQFLDASFVETGEFDPDGIRLVVPCRDRAIHVWDLDTAEKLRTIENAHTSTINRVRWSRDGRLLVSASNDGAVKIWDSLTGDLVRHCLGHEGPAYDAVFDLEAKSMVSVGPGEMFVWDLSSPPGKTTLGGGKNRSDHYHMDLAWHPSGDFIALSSMDGPEIWDVSRGPATKLSSEPMGKTSWSPNGRWILYRAQDAIVVHDVETGEVLARLKGPHTRRPPSHTVQVSWSPEGDRLYVHTTGFAFVHDDLPNSTEGRPLAGEVGYLRFALSPDGQLYALSKQGQAIGIFDAKTDEHIATIASDSFQPPPFVPTYRFDPTNEMLAVIDSSRLLLFDPQTGEQLQEFHEHSSRIMTVAWHPSSSRVATGSLDQTVVLYDPEGGMTAILPCTHHVQRLAFSPEGHRLAALDQTGRLTIWDIRGALR